MSYSTWSSDDEEDRRYTDLPHHLFEEMTDDEEELTELGHRFWCTLCAPFHLGHRFTCGLCAFQATTKGRDQCTEDEESDNALEGSEGL